jgi:hypothetical protein
MLSPFLLKWTVESVLMEAVTSYWHPLHELTTLHLLFLSFLPQSFSTFLIFSNRTVTALSVGLVFLGTFYIRYLCVLIVAVHFCLKCLYFLLFLVPTFGYSVAPYSVCHPGQNTNYNFRIVEANTYCSPGRIHLLAKKKTRSNIIVRSLHKVYGVRYTGIASLIFSPSICCN